MGCCEGVWTGAMSVVIPQSKLCSPLQPNSLQSAQGLSSVPLAANSALVDYQVAHAVWVWEGQLQARVSCRGRNSSLAAWKQAIQHQECAFLHLLRALCGLMVCKSLGFASFRPHGFAKCVDLGDRLNEEGEFNVSNAFAAAELQGVDGSILLYMYTAVDVQRAANSQQRVALGRVAVNKSAEVGCCFWFSLAPSPELEATVHLSCSFASVVFVRSSCPTCFDCADPDRPRRSSLSVCPIWSEALLIYTISRLAEQTTPAYTLLSDTISIPTNLPLAQTSGVKGHETGPRQLLGTLCFHVFLFLTEASG